ncbi:MAG: long-chain fatty acid--CoA ligase [Treponema sp.]|nr:long-chain fatty acid--CoA ligase [Treponema sp.]
MAHTVPQMLKETTLQYPNVAAQYAKDTEGNFKPVTYKQLLDTSYHFGGGLLSLGTVRGEHVGLLADNRKEWLQADMGIMAIGAVDVPRGCDATERELRFIFSTAECKTIVVENEAQIQKVLGFKEDLPNLCRFISFDAVQEETKSKSKEAGVEVLQFEEVLQLGTEYCQQNPTKLDEELDKGKSDDLACLIFTSGTTGEPKGVMLTHGNFLAQLEDLRTRIYLHPGERCLSVLPVWHAFERLCEYVVLFQAGGLCYSKPVGSILLADFLKINPQMLPAVPRVFEAVYEGVNRTMRKTGGVVYALFKFFVAVAILHSRIHRRLFRQTARFKNDYLVLSWIVLFIPWLLLYPLKALGGVIIFKKIRAKLGNNFRGGVSGGGALPPQIDEFFWAIGVNLVEGYGLTETAPVVSVRPFRSPVFGTIGRPLKDVQVRIVDENGNVLPKCQKGTVQVKGPTVMKGYYKRDDLTAKVIDKDGWFDTGDIGLLTLGGELVLRGRIKDTIVLRGGENVEPLSIEMRLNNSRFIAQSMVVGQDQRFLAALIVPSEEEIVGYAQEQQIPYNSYSELLKTQEIKKLIDTEIQTAISAKNGFRLFEKVSRFAILEKPFVVGETLSAKQEIMRHKISQLYEKEITELFK